MAPKDGNLNLYAEYNKVLRAWLVSFGFGVPALFIINESVQMKLLAARNTVLSLLLVSVLLNGCVAGPQSSMTDGHDNFVDKHRGRPGNER